MTLEDQIRAIVRDELAKAKPPPAEALVTVAEYARRRAISVSTVRAAVADKRLAVTRIGRAVRIAPTAAIAKRAPESANARAVLKMMR